MDTLSRLKTKKPRSAGAPMKPRSCVPPLPSNGMLEHAKPSTLSERESPQNYSEKNPLGGAFDRLMQDHPVLKPAAEKKLLSSDLAEGKKRELLWKHNLRFAVMLANEAFNRRHPSCVITPQELAAEAVLTLWETSLKFDWSLGVVFTAYARWPIKRSLSHACRRSASGVTLPTQFLLKLAAAKTKGGEVYNGDPRHLFSGVSSIDAQIEGGTDLHSLLADDDTRIGGDDTPENIETLLDSIDRFNVRTSQLLRAFYGIGTPRLSGEELAEKYGVSRQAINTSIQKGLKRLRAIVATKGYRLSDFV